MIAFAQRKGVCTHASGKISSNGHSYFRVFTNPLIVVKKHGWIYSKVEWIIFIKVTSTKMKWIKESVLSCKYDNNKRFFDY